MSMDADDVVLGLPGESNADDSSVGLPVVAPLPKTEERHTLALLLAQSIYPGLRLKPDTWVQKLMAYSEDCGDSGHSLYDAADAILAAGYRLASSPGGGQ